LNAGIACAPTGQSETDAIARVNAALKNFATRDALRNVE
jgi:hypothetical protein